MFTWSLQMISIPKKHFGVRFQVPCLFSWVLCCYPYDWLAGGAFRSADDNPHDHPQPTITAKPSSHSNSKTNPEQQKGHPAQVSPKNTPLKLITSHHFILIPCRLLQHYLLPNRTTQTFETKKYTQIPESWIDQLVGGWTNPFEKYD